MKSHCPKGLSKEARGIWRAVESEWELDPHSRTILQVSLEAFDEMRKAQELIAKHGPIFATKSGQIKKNPALELLKIARAHFLHSWRMLNLGVEPPKEI